MKPGIHIWTALAVTGIELVLGSASVAAPTEFTDGEWSDLAPPQRTYHAALYDSLRHRMIVVGGAIGFGSVAKDAWYLELLGPPTWRRLLMNGTRPDPSTSEVAVYAPTQDRMLLLQRGFSEVWSVDLGTNTSAPIAQTGVHPGPRYEVSAIYDPVRNRVLVFGGYSPGVWQDSVFDDVWALDLAGSPTWRLLTATGTGPTPRHGHVAAYDRAHDRMIIFGGSGYGGVTNSEVWALELTGQPTWVQLAPSGPTPGARAGSLSTLDPSNNRMLVFGGTPGPGNDLWALALTDPPVWTAVSPPGSPPSARAGATLILDRLQQRLLLYGGSSDGRAWEVWSLGLNATAPWSRIGSVPPGRNGHSVVVDGATRQMVVFGGLKHPDYSFLADVWSRDLSLDGAWTQLTPTGPGPAARMWHTAVFDSTKHRMVVFGGTGAQDYGDTWTLSLGENPAWVQLHPAGQAPAARYGSCAVYDAARERMVLFGGVSGGSGYTYRNDVWTLSLGDAPAWSQIVPLGTPPVARSQGTAVYDPVGDRIIVFGGLSSAVASGTPDTVWALSMASTPSWSILSAPGSPGGRFEHSAVYDSKRMRMIIFGGDSDYGAYDMWALSLGDQPAWSRLAPAGTGPTYRMGHTAVYDTLQDRMIVYGGFTPGQGINTTDYNDTWSLAWSGGTTPVLVSVEASADLEGVHILWHGPGLSGAAVRVFRCANGNPWVPRDLVTADGMENISYDDPDVTPGGRYGYRLGVVEGGNERYVGEVWLSLPATPEFSLAGLVPNPTTGAFNVSFTLPDALPARLDVLDVLGRRVGVRDVGRLGVGVHVMDPLGGRRLPAGIYLVRLTRGMESFTRRAVVCR